MAFTYSWTTIPDTDTDPDSPITTGLMTGINHDLIYLREWIGQSYYAGAVPNHNHDGVNSSLIASTGASLFFLHGHEIFDDFMCSGFNTSVWTVTSTPSVVTGTNLHYALFDDTSDNLQGKGVFRLEMAKLILEFRMKVGTAGTTWGTNMRMGIRGSTRGADFINAGVADKVRCQTRGSGGTQNTDVTVGGAGIDDWHAYKVDLTSVSQALFYVDGTLVATHATAVPDAQDMSVEINGDTTIDMWVCRCKLYATQEGSASTA